MRTVIIIGFLLVSASISEQTGYELDSDVSGFIAWLIIVCIIMDLGEFLKKLS